MAEKGSVHISELSEVNRSTLNTSKETKTRSFSAQTSENPQKNSIQPHMKEDDMEAHGFFVFALLPRLHVSLRPRGCPAWRWRAGCTVISEKMSGLDGSWQNDWRQRHRWLGRRRRAGRAVRVRATTEHPASLCWFLCVETRVLQRGTEPLLQHLLLYQLTAKNGRCLFSPETTKTEERMKPVRRSTSLSNRLFRNSSTAVSAARYTVKNVMSMELF